MVYISGVEEAVVRRVGSCSASLRVPGGRTSVSWHLVNDTLSYTSTIPFGYTAELRFPLWLRPSTDTMHTNDTHEAEGEDSTRTSSGGASPQSHWLRGGPVTHSEISETETDGRHVRQYVDEQAQVVVVPLTSGTTSLVMTFRSR